MFTYVFYVFVQVYVLQCTTYTVRRTVYVVIKNKIYDKYVYKYIKILIK